MIDATRGIESQDLNIFSLIQKNQKGLVEDMRRLREVTADKKIELADEGLKFERCRKWKKTTV